MTKDPPIEPLSPEAAERSVRLAKQRESEAAGTGGDLLRYISQNAQAEIAALIQERDGLILKVQTLNERISTLQTHALVSPKETK